MVSPEPDPDDAVVLVGTQRAVYLGRGIYQLRYENALGASTIRFLNGVLPPLHVEVVTRKLGSGRGPVAQTGAYRQMVKDVVSAMRTTPFDFIGSTGHASLAAGDSPAPLFTLYFLLHHGRKVAAAIAAIGDDPHRVLTLEDETRPVARANRLSPRVIRWGLANGREWLQPENPRVAWFQGGGKNYLPAVLLQERREDTFDNPENRFVKHFVGVLLQEAEALARLIESPRYGDTPLPGGLAEVRGALAEAGSRRWLEDVGNMTLLPTYSQVLHRRDGYRELFELYGKYLQAQTPFGDDLNRAIFARDVATLYEYWCFLRLVAMLGQPGALGASRVTIRPDETGGVAWGASARFADSRLRLVYNRSFRGGHGSYSVGLRPDFVLIGPDGPEVVLDAKFRLTWENPAGRKGEPSADDPDWMEASPQAGDIYKMHTYRDALGVRAAVAVYPGTVSAFYGSDSQRRTGLSVLDVIIDSSLSGVGAIPLRPGGNE